MTRGVDVDHDAFGHAEHCLVVVTIGEVINVGGIAIGVLKATDCINFELEVGTLESDVLQGVGLVKDELGVAEGEI
jgi:hypothetical protein